MNAKAALEGRSSPALPEVRGVSLSGSELTLELSDSAWWIGSDERRNFALTMTNVVEWKFSGQGITQTGNPLPGDRRFEILSEHPLLLNHGPRASIYGQDALPDPYRFFLEFHRLVRDVLKIPRDPVRYLNWGGTLNEWLSFVYSRTFLLLTAPVTVVEGAKELLEAQSASFIVLPETGNGEVAGRTLLLVGESWAIGDPPTFRAG
ncbi:MAG: hypothetical protein U0136_01605 [Bdellovibrionota bacterium]